MQRLWLRARVVLSGLYLLVFIVALCPAAGAKLSGQARLDSLISELNGRYRKTDDTNKVKLLNEISYSYNAIDPAQGLKYGAEALNLATTLSYEPGIADANVKIGVNHMRLSDFPQALAYMLRSLKGYEALNDKKGIASTMGNIGNVYINMENYPKALAYYHKILKMFEEQGSKSQIAITLSNIANVYTNEGDLPRALDYSYRALKLATEVGDKRGIGSNTQNIADIYQMQRDYIKALHYNREAMVWLEQIDDKRGVAVCLGSIGECYLAMVKDSIKVPADSLAPASDAERLKLAIDYSKKAISLCKEIGSIDNQQVYVQNLSDALVLAGDYKGALENYRQAVALYDSVYGNSAKVKILNLEAQRDLELKNKQIELDKLAVEKKKNERIFYITGIVLLLLVIGVMMRNYRSQKKSNIQLSVEKKRSEDLLLNILPAEVAEELKAKGTAAARHFDNVTVIFTDFVNFTRAGERMSAQELIAELHTCFRAFDDIMTRYNIEKIKTIGDAYLAVCGLPVADERHAENVVSAAIEITAFMNQRQRQMGNKTFAVRIGIHSGSVVAGIVGVKKFAYDIWGDTVNTAARMEQTSEPGKINISQATYEQVKDKFSCTYRGHIDAKNKGEMSMYFVLPAES